MALGTVLVLPAPLGADSGLQWEPGRGFRRAKLPVPAAGRTGFSEVSAAAAGILFTNRLEEPDAAANNNLMNGSGVAAGDFDGDGRCDLYFCAIRGTNAFYRNLDGWRFEDVTAQAGVGLAGRQSTGALFADVNGDGRLDLLVATLGEGVHCFINEGGGRFRDATAECGLTSDTGSMSLAMADVDGDGALDLYVANYGAVSLLRSGGRAEIKKVGDQWVVTGPYGKRLRIVDGRLEEVGEAGVLYLNDGRGHFTAVPWDSEFFLDEDGRPKPPPLDFGLSVQMRDLSGDRAPEIYVCNDFQTLDRIWLNDGHGRFRALPRLAMRKQCFSSMGVDFADLDRDGFLDFCVTEMMSHDHARRLRQIVGMAPMTPMPGRFDDRPEVPRNTLFWNRGDVTFAELANYAGIPATDWTWQPVFLDVDLDGFEDLLIVSGMMHDVQDRDVLARVRALGRQSPEESRTNLLMYPPLLTPNYAFRNRHDLTFEDTSNAWGFNSTQISQGMALADLDNDGALDIVINCLNGPPLLLRNESAAPRVAVRLQGLPPNTRGIGGVVRVRGGPVDLQSQEILAGGRYLSSDDAMRTFAAGSVSNRLTIEVAWRSGKNSLLRDASPNYVYEFDEAVADAPSPAAPPPAPPPTLFRDVTAALGHVHHEELFNDFARQPLLTRLLSSLGPAVAWADLDGDGQDELAIGTGRGGQVEVYHWAAGGRFQALAANRRWQAADDTTGMALWTGADGGAVLLAGLANYESEATNGPALLQVSAADGRCIVNALAQTNLAAAGASPGPLAVADVDADGTLDLFVGMRVVPGAYPQSSGSRLYRQVAGKLLLDLTNSAVLADAGMVSGAVWTDLDGDGYPDLVLACEWGPIRIFHNDRGQLAPWNAALTWPAASTINHQPSTLNQLTGWWSSVACGDFDEDGRLDFVVGNWGLNDAYQASAEHPLQLYYGDLAGQGTVDLIEAYYAPDVGADVPRRSLNALGQAFPFLAAHYPTHAAFATASITDLLKLLPNPAHRAAATTLETMLFLNRGSNFVAVPLPAQAQWAPVFGIVVADADGDGHEDIFLGQNFLALRQEWPRLDAGRGLWLMGDGQGHFQPMPGQKAGVTVYGEQRGAAAGDFNGDGRVDLVVSQNGAVTRVFENVGGRPGLRVRLQGTTGNPRGIGATVRLSDGKRWGPTRLVTSGSGYWSCDSATQVMSFDGEATQIEVRWPGGKRFTADLPKNAKEIILSWNDAMKVVR